MNATATSTDLAASVAHWWALAGLDVAVADAPRDWLTKARPVAPVLAEPPAVAAQPAPQPVAPVATTMPNDLDGFMAWLAADPDQPEARFSQSRVLPTALHDADALIVTDMPTQEDVAAGRLFSGPDAALLAAMLGAVGVSMERTATASLLLARPTGGVIDDSLLERAAPRLRQFIRLNAPRAVILLGDKTSRAIEQTNGPVGGLSTQAVNPENGTISAMSLPAPFVLLKHPERKAAAWAKLRHLAKR